MNVASLIIIEDDVRIRQTLAARLAERGHDVRAAGSGVAGLELAVSGNPDAVILDLGLPDIDG
ncbi:MAG TPA: response regulator transcription factor, partial [Actinobacteria bacterium]|nr:response regulator transcription factor [Actinomycetota bacterium]